MTICPNFPLSPRFKGVNGTFGQMVSFGLMGILTKKICLKIRLSHFPLERVTA